MTRLRLGVLLPGMHVPQWVKTSLDAAIASGQVELSGAMLLPPDMLAGFNDPLWRMFHWLDAHLGQVSPDALERVDLSPLFAGLPVSRTQPPPADVLYQPLPLLRPQGLETAAPGGIWMIYTPPLAVLPPGYWEVLTHQPVTPAQLVHVPGMDVLAQSFPRTHHLTAQLNANRLGWKYSSLLLRALQNPTPSNARVIPPPDARAWKKYLPGYAARYVAYWWDKLFGGVRWSLRLLPSTQPVLEPGQLLPLNPPRGVFWGDPFPWEQDGQRWLLFEEFIYARNRGRLCALRLDESGQPVGTPISVLEQPYHLSYPFLFSYQGQTYLLPEAGAGKTITAYRCLHFPDCWEPAAELMSNVVVADSTLLEHAGRWWLFTTLKAHPGATTWDELFIYYADSPLSTQWTAHPRNPVVSDARCARMGGNFLHLDGRLLRPAQDCSTSYGAALRLMQVTRLSETDYAEQEFSCLHPAGAGETGLHTFNFAAGISVVDVKSPLARWQR